MTTLVLSKEPENMKTFTQQSDRMPADYEPKTITGKTIKDAQKNAMGLLSVDGPRGLKFQAEDGSGFTVSLYEGRDKIWDKNGKVIG